MRLRRIAWLVAAVVVIGGRDRGGRRAAASTRRCRRSCSRSATTTSSASRRADKGLDPALIAGVIYTESRFRDQTSHAGAKGLMQILPSTADDIARKSGGTAFMQGDLANPQVNISYGSYYLRYLLRRYGGNEVLAIAAYNAGEGRVDQWIFEARHRGEEFDHARHIPFPETRHYVQQVLEARGKYREQYARELGL